MSRSKASPRKVLFVFGTRPEAIKLAPLILKMKRDRRFSPVVCVTSQHRQMLDQVLRFFRIRPDWDLRVMRPNQSLCGLTAAVLERIHEVLRRETPTMVLVQGDTTSTLAGALGAFYHRISLGHVEAGLRTRDKGRPFPEEMNRRLTTPLADIHFAPTREARDNLLRDGVPASRIVVTGNTAVDALLHARKSLESDKGRTDRLRRRFRRLGQPGETMILVTGHRRENFGEGLRNICQALRDLARARPSLRIVYPVHLNPNVRRSVNGILRGIENVHLLEPLDYESFVYLMMRSHFIVTDSGGIQEEAPSLGRPVLVIRDVTERMEAVRAGTARLVGADRDSIVAHAERLLDDDRAYRRMAGRKNPFGDGRASDRIIQALARLGDEAT